MTNNPTQPELEELDKFLQTIYDAGKNRESIGAYESGKISIRAGLKIKGLLIKAHNQGKLDGAIELGRWIQNKDNGVLLMQKSWRNLDAEVRRLESELRKET